MREAATISPKEANTVARAAATTALLPKEKSHDALPPKPQLTVGPPNDPLEHEADAMADAVVAAAEASGSSACKDCGGSADVRRAKMPGMQPQRLQRESWDVDESECTATLNWELGCFFQYNADLREGWTPEREVAFMENAKPAVENEFNSSAFRLVPRAPQYSGGWFRQLVSPTGLMDATIPCPCAQGIVPRVNLGVRAAGPTASVDWHSFVYANTSGQNQQSGAAASSEVFGHLDEADVHMRTDGVAQVPIAHEFAHSIGLDHPGAGIAGADEYSHAGLDSESRPVDGTVDLMGGGMGLRPFYFDRWKDHLNTTYDGCDFQVAVANDATAPAAPIQRKCADCEKEAELQRKSLPESSGIKVYRKCAHCEAEEQKMRRKQDGQSGEFAVDDNVATAINAKKGRGSALDDNTKQLMEQQFDTDFSHVNIHHDSEAATLSNAINAKAFTTHNDIFFNANQYNTSTHSGRHLLAHELTHVVQQTGMVQRAPTLLEPADSDIEVISVLNPKSSIKENIKILQRIDTEAKRFLVVDGLKLHIYDNEDTLLVSLNLKDTVALPPFFYYIDRGFFYIVAVRDSDGALVFQGKKQAKTDKEKADVKILDDAFDYENWFLNDDEKAKFHKTVDGAVSSMVVLPWSDKSKKSTSKDDGPILSINYPDWFKLLKSDVEVLFASEKKADSKNELLPDSLSFYGSDKVQMQRGTDAWTIQINKGKQLAFYTIQKAEYDKETDKKQYASKVYAVLKGKVKLLNDTKDINNLEQKEITDIDGSGEKKKESKWGWAHKLKAEVQLKLDQQKLLEPQAVDFPFKIALTVQGEGESAEIYFRVYVQASTPASPDQIPELIAATIPAVVTEKDTAAYWAPRIRAIAGAILKGNTTEDKDKAKKDIDPEATTDGQHSDETILPPYPSKIYARGMNADRTTTNFASNLFRMVLTKSAYHPSLIDGVTIEMGQLTSYNWKVVPMPSALLAIHQDPLANEEDVTKSTNEHVVKNKQNLGEAKKTYDPDADWDQSIKMEVGDWLLVSWANTAWKNGEGPRRATSWAGFPFSVFTPEELAKKHAYLEQNQIKDLQQKADATANEKEKKQLLDQISELKSRDKLSLSSRTDQDLSETDTLLNSAHDLLKFIDLRKKEGIPFSGNKTNDPFLIALKALDSKLYLIYLLVKELYGAKMDDASAVKQYIQQLEKQKKELQGLQKRIKRLLNNSAIHPASPQYRTVTALVKEDDGNVVPVSLIMCWHKDSKVNAENPASNSYKMMLFDVTFDSPKNDDMVYVGGSFSNEMDAAKSAFINFGERNKYGDGQVVYRVPALNLAWNCKSITTWDEYLEYALAAIGITLLVAGAIVSGGALAPASAAAIGAVVTALGIATAVVGAAFAVRNINSRVEKGTFQFDASFALDIVNIIGAIVQPIAIAGKLGGAAKNINTVVKLANAANRVARVQRLDKILMVYDMVELGANSILISMKVAEDVAAVKLLGLPKDKEDELLQQVAMEALQAGAMLAFSSLSKLKDTSDAIAAKVENSKYKNVVENGWIDANGKVSDAAPPFIQEAAGHAQKQGAPSPGKPTDATPGKPLPPEVQGQKAWVESQVLNMAKHPSAEAGHELTITERGRIIRCSDFCTDLRLKYGKIVGQDPALDAELAALERRALKAAESKNNTEAAAVSKEAAALEKKLIEIDLAREKLFGGTHEDWDKAINDIENWEPGKITGGKKSGQRIDDVKIPKRQRRLIDVLDIMNAAELKLLGKGGYKMAMDRVKNVMGKKISDIEVLKQHWDAVKADLMGGKTADQLGKAKMIELYNAARGKFWDRVRKDPAAVEFLKKHGFGFENDGAPMAILGPKGAETTQVGNITDQERRISLDHIVEKAQGDNWKKALDADNLEFMFQNANSWKEIVQVKFDMRSSTATTSGTTVHPKLRYQHSHLPYEAEANAIEANLTQQRLKWPTLNKFSNEPQAKPNLNAHPKSLFMHYKIYKPNAGQTPDAVGLEPYDKKALRLAPPTQAAEVQAKTLAAMPEKETPVHSFANVNDTSGLGISKAMEQDIERQRGGGQGLEAPTLSFMQHYFKRNFSAVRVHNNGVAADLNAKLNAHAFTTGNDIFFNSQQYNPRSEQGNRLLAHELTHVAQQQQSGHEAIQRDSITMDPLVVTAGNKLPSSVDKLSGDNADTSGVSLSHGNDPRIEQGSMTAETPLPWTGTSAWKGEEIAAHLGQYDRIPGTDSDAVRCVQTVGLVSHILISPAAVNQYLGAMALQGVLGNPSPRRKAALDVIELVKHNIASGTANYGHLYWVIEAVHDLFYKDDTGTPEGDLHDQVVSAFDYSASMTKMNVFCNTPEALLTEANKLYKGEQLMLNTWGISFNSTFDMALDDKGAATNKLTFDVTDDKGKFVKRANINRIDTKTKPDPKKHDRNRDSISGHQMLIFKDAATGDVKMYEPELAANGQHLFNLTKDASMLPAMLFNDQPAFELYHYVQIMGKIVPKTATAGFGM
jgi:hypothetical protein